MIYLVGDTHGTFDLDKVLDFFEIEVLLRDVSKEDYLIILGDVGVCWDGGEKDAWVLKKLRELPVTVLWLDGNHENFDLLREYPVTEWNGGKVQRIAPDVIHLMRGYVYYIEGKLFWVFGGGMSVDKIWRREGISWWKEEMPSYEEYDRGLDNLQKAEFQVDYILTHTAPRKVAEQLVDVMLPGEEALQYYLQDVAERTSFAGWYFGHWHMDKVVDEKFYGLMEEIVRLLEQ
ncbi:MAG: metallophosphoesterase [Lachnospiraceae bacterium]|nr:metallophosphoesterase [Lachnospiraceae bacterium]